MRKYENCTLSSLFKLNMYRVEITTKYILTKICETLLNYKWKRKEGKVNQSVNSILASKSAAAASAGLKDTLYSVVR